MINICMSILLAIVLLFIVCFAVLLVWAYLDGEPAHCSTDDALWEAICTVESGNDQFAYNPKEKAAGIAQIRPCVVDDLNRIAKSEKWTLLDRWNIEKSRKMFNEYTGHYAKTGNDEERARIWNGGPRGAHKHATKEYWNRVKDAMDKRKGQ